MEFLLYLSPDGRELLHNIVSAKFNVYENIEYCQTKPIYGYVSYPSKKFVICTNNIRNKSSDIRYDVTKTLTHESVHAIHICRNQNAINISNKFQLSEEKYYRLQRSLNMANTISYQKEYEAYLLEDHPEKVIDYVKKFCF